MVEIVNRQRKISLEAESFLDFTERSVRLIGAAASGKGLTVAFVSDRKMRELNKLFRGKPGTTDVLSFRWDAPDFEASAEPALNETEDYLGDIVISVEQARKQAAENKLSLETELKQLILHGILHLCGFDHETDAGQMNALELELRDKLLIS